MSESQTEQPKPKARTSCTFRVFQTLAIHDGPWIPAGVIADLSMCSDAFLRWALERKIIETADPTEAEPLFNQGAGTVKRNPCPCSK